MLKLDCPSCGKEREYRSPRGYNEAKSKKTVCRTCRNKAIAKSRRYDQALYDTKDAVGNFHRKCSGCGKDISYTTSQAVIKAEKEDRLCYHCTVGPRKHSSTKGHYENVSLAWFKVVSDNAAKRSKSFSLRPEHIYALWVLQEGACALSGIPLKMHRTSQDPDGTVSIDRIDNDRGYHPDNVQLVHKQINLMRGPLSVDQFVALCASVSIHNEIGFD